MTNNFRIERKLLARRILLILIALTLVMTAATANSHAATPKKGDGWKNTAHFHGRVFKMYRQNEGSYRNAKFANSLPAEGTIHTNGCGPTAIAIIMSGYGRKENPGQVGAGLLATAKKMKSKRVTRNAVFARYLRDRGFKVKGYANPQPYKVTAKQLKSALQAKKQVVFWVGGKNIKCWKKFTGSGYHYIAIIGINKAGNKVYVINPNSKNNGWHDINSVAKAAHIYRGWIEIWK